MADAEPVLLSHEQDGIVTLTLNRPEALNALSTRLRRALVQRFQALQEDPAAGAVILTGAGRAFCAGLDLKELGQRHTPTFGGDGEPEEIDVIAAMERFDRPILGAVNGFAITGGFELALACDILIGSTQARFADTHARVGILPGWGLSQKLPRLIGIQRAKLLSLTGNFLEARPAEHWGLLARVVAPEELLPTCESLARDVLSCVPEVVRGYKRLIDEGFGLSLAEGLALERRRAGSHARQVAPEEIARRRQDVQQRGRSQSTG